MQMTDLGIYQFSTFFVNEIEIFTLVSGPHTLKHQWSKSLGQWTFHFCEMKEPAEVSEKFNGEWLSGNYGERFSGNWNTISKMNLLRGNGRDSVAW